MRCLNATASGATIAALLACAHHPAAASDTLALPGENPGAAALAASAGLAILAQDSVSGGSSFEAAEEQALPPFPADDSDLQDVLARAQAYLAAANCEGLECPVIDCAEAEEALQALTEMEAYLDALVYSLGLANEAAMQHFETIAKNNISTGEGTAALQDNLALQRLLHDLGSVILDVTSIASFVKGLGEMPLSEREFGELVQQLDGHLEAVKDLESLVSTSAGAAGASSPTPISDIAGQFGDADLINDAKSHLSDATSVIKEAVQNGKDWRKALQDSGKWSALQEAAKTGAIADLGQIAGRFLKAWSSRKLEEQQARLKELLEVAEAGDLVQASAYIELQRVQQRRWAAMDALAATREAKGPYMACVTAECGSFSIIRPLIPNFEQTYGGETRYSYGAALLWLNEAIRATLPRMQPVPFRDECPEEPEEDLLTIGDLGLQLVQESSEWCTFGLTDPRDLPTDEGDDPRDTPVDDDGDDPRDAPGGTPDDGDDPRDTPVDDDGDDPRDAPLPDPWDDPRDTPDDGDDPRDAPDGPFVPVPVDDDDGDDPRDAPEDEGDDPRDAPTVPLVVKATSAAQAGGQVQQAVAGQQVKLFAPSQIPANIALPVGDAPKPQTDASAEPLSCTTGADGSCTIPVPVCELGVCENGVPVIPASGLELEVSAENSKSYNVLADAGTQLGAGLDPFVIGRTPSADGREWVTVLASGDQVGALQSGIGQLQGLLGSTGLYAIEENLCRTKLQSAPNDPHFEGKGAWGQAHDDQWAIKRVGLTGEADSAWARLGANPRDVVVAVIDSGLDWNHADFDWGNIWNNPGEIPGNGVDDDGNGYVDDVIGWDFLGQNNKPWDHDGHGTLTAGIIAADSDNGVGIAGINPHARIMVLKALNAFGNSRASFIAHAIRYAADNGARVVNLSVGGPGLTGIERDAVAYARSKGVLIVAASGNDGTEITDYGIAASDQVLTVAATGLDDEHPNFSNWGPGIDLAAPGADVLSLRARRTDTVRGIPDVPYTDGEAYVGADKRYYRVSGTSFAAPIVAGIASLVLSKRPELTVEQLETILVQSAEDIQTPGRDNFSGAGLVDARAALDFDPSVNVEAAIAGVEVVQGEGGPAVRVNGTIAADRLASARIEIGAGREPAEFRAVASGLAVSSGALADIPADNFRAAREWTIRLVVTHANGTTREARFLLDVGG